VVRALDRIACRELKPDITVLIDIDLETSLARAKNRNARVRAGGTGPAESRIDDESAVFHERVRLGYLALAAQEPARFLVIDGRAPVAEVARRVKEALAGRV
jgi:dTMP kinase